MITWGRIENRADRVLIVGGGPSLGRVDQQGIVRAAESGAHIITVNGAIDGVRCYHDWFTLDFDERTRGFAARRWVGTRAIAAVPADFGTSDARLPQHRCAPPADVLYLKRISGDGYLGSKHGLAIDPETVHSGNSVWGCLGIAWHMGARRVAFLGLDANKEPGWPGRHQPRELGHLNNLFATALPQLEERGVEVRVGNPQSRVTCFERVEPAAALDWISARL